MTEYLGEFKTSTQIQGYLAHKKMHPPRTQLYAYA